jgi:enoyl-CoA hydratase
VNVTAWSPSSAHIRLELADGAAVIRLDRPDVLNALTIEMLVDVAAGIRALGNGDGADAVVLTGEGRAFSSGDDLADTEGIDVEASIRLIEAFNDVTRAIFETTVPLIAALNGIAVGGAAEIACACDLRVGGPRSDFLFPENGIGLTVSNGSTAILPSLVGRRALGLVLLGDRIPGARAHELGLIDVWVDDQGQVLGEALRVAAMLAEPGRSTALHLELLRPPLDEIERAMARELDASIRAFERGLPGEGIRRFFARQADKRAGS